MIEYRRLPAHVGHTTNKPVVNPNPLKIRPFEMFLNLKFIPLNAKIFKAMFMPTSIDITTPRKKLRGIKRNEKLLAT